VSQQFDRRWRVQVDDVVIDELRVAFKVERNLKAEPNKLELSIYNLSSKTRDRFTKASGEVRVQIEAGYKDSIGLIFMGDARRVYTLIEGPNIALKIEGGDGEKALRSARFSESFGPGTKMADVLTKMADKLGVNAGAAKDRIRKGDFRGGVQEYVQSFNFSGVLRDEFDRQMKSAGLTWSVQNGELQILSDDETTQQEALRFSSDSGLIGSPTLADKGVVKFQCLMQSALSPGRKVVLDSKSIKETLKITKLTFRGDSHGTDWLVDVEGKKAG